MQKLPIVHRKASSEGKAWIHSAGSSKTNPWGGEQNAFLDSMAEAGKSVVDSLNGKILYINVMNRLSVDCDCNGNPAALDGSKLQTIFQEKAVFQFHQI